VLEPRPGEWPEQRVGLFVDTQNLYYAAKDFYGQQVDYAKLLELSLRGRRLAHATAYVVERGGDTSAFGFVTKLSALGYRVRRRRVRLQRTREGGGEVYEGDWDLGIAADMVRSWAKLDVIALASGDGDFAPMAALAQEQGCRVEVLAFRESVAQELLDQADRFVHLPDAGALLTQ
jgi:uncharacterized LabA/DUF88 family protein